MSVIHSMNELKEKNPGFRYILLGTETFDKAQNLFMIKKKIHMALKRLEKEGNFS